MRNDEVQHVGTSATDDELQRVVEQQLANADSRHEHEDFTTSAASVVSNCDGQQYEYHDDRASELGDPLQNFDRLGVAVAGAPFGYRCVGMTEPRVPIDHGQQQAEDYCDREDDDEADG